MIISVPAAMIGSYDYLQVALSVLIAVAASYAALDLAGRVTATRGGRRWVWLLGGATAMGIGIWSMHFVGMLAFHLPVPVEYYWPTVLLSIVVPIFASAFALHVSSREKLGVAQALIASLFMGGAISGMHYIGMAAMRLAALMRFQPFLVALSVICGIVFSFSALLLAFDLREETKGTVPRKIASATVMGIAVSAMHYTGMASARFMPTAGVPNLSHAVSVSTLGTLGIAAVTLLLLSLAVFMSAVDRQLSDQAMKLEQRVAERTNQLTMLNVQLADSEERFRKLVQALPDAILVHSEERIMFVNPFGVQLLGAQRAEQLVGMEISQIVHPDYLPAMRQRNREAYENGTPSPPMENVLIRLDGSSVEVESAAIPMSWEGSPAIEVVIRDIRERKQAEQAVQQWQKRLELAQRAGLRIGLWDWDVRANKVVWSDESYRQFGFTRDTFSGRVEDGVARIHPEDRPRVEDAIRRVLAGGTEYAAQYRVMRPDETVCWIEAHGVVVRDGPTHMLGIGIDVTSLKKTEQVLQEARMELAHVTRIASMGELAASIAHEINQPLAAVVANGSAALRWLAMKPPNLAEAQDAMSRAVGEANRASDVIARIRSLLQKAPTQMGPVVVNELIRGVLTLAENELLRGGVILETELAPGVPAVVGDRVQLQQVILNLIMNAIDAMATVTDRPRKLLVKSLRQENGALIQVEDSGKGLDVEHAHRIFEPFFTTKPKGIGMGLSIARSIVEAHGGRLWATPADSSPGTVFQFTLPEASHERP